MPSDKGKNLPIATANPSYSPAHALPAPICRSDTASSLLSYPGVIAELPAHPFPSPAACCWEHPAASSQLQLVPAFQKGFSPPLLPVISGWVLDCLLLTASLSPHFHPSGRGTLPLEATCCLQRHSRWDTPPSATVKD